MSADRVTSTNSVEIISVELKLFEVKSVFSMTISDGGQSLRKARSDCSRNHTKRGRYQFFTSKKYLTQYPEKDL